MSRRNPADMTPLIRRAGLASRRTKTIEGVPYYAFRVTFRLATGERRRWIRWSPALSYAYQEVGRELFERFGEAGVRPHSATIVAA